MIEASVTIMQSQWLKDREKITKDRSGGIAVLAAGTFAMLGLCVGLALDFQLAYQLQHDLQAATDNAAIGAARNPAYSDAELTEDAKRVFFAIAPAHASFDEKDIVASVHRQPEKYSTLVTVTARGSMPTTFMRLARITSVPVAVKSVSKAIDASAMPCILALDPSSPATLSANGNATIQAENCGIYVNSSNSGAVEQKGAGQIAAESIRTVGSYWKNGHYSPLPVTGKLAADDPLASVAEPEIPDHCTYSNQTFNASQTFPGGTVYCGNITFKGNATFSKGIHYFKNATVRINANSNTIGNNVMLYFGPGSTLDKAAGKGTLSITAMTDGPYQGIAIFGSRQSTTLTPFVINGNNTFSIGGAVYLPKSIVSLAGTSDMVLSAVPTALIGWQISFSGTSNLILKRAGNPGPLAIAQNKVTLAQ